jgi:hypothetical protein
VWRVYTYPAGTSSVEGREGVGRRGGSWGLPCYCANDHSAREGSAGHARQQLGLIITRRIDRIPRGREPYLRQQLRLILTRRTRHSPEKENHAMRGSSWG